MTRTIDRTVITHIQSDMPVRTPAPVDKMVVEVACELVETASPDDICGVATTTGAIVPVVTPTETSPVGSEFTADIRVL